MKQRQRAFTLLELFVCFAILTLISTFFISKSKSFLDEHKFQSSSKKIQREILLTKNLAITYNIDIEFLLEQKNGKIYLTRKTNFLPNTIRSLFFENIYISNVMIGKEDEIKEIKFYSSGWIEGEDSFLLYAKNQMNKQYSVYVKQSIRKVL
jgi:Tfp pilus assembly protein FimT